MKNLRNVLPIIFFILIFFNIKIFAYANSIDVYDFDGFEKAIMNPSITKINIKKSFTFTRNIDKGIPNRDILINGNKEDGIIINSANWSIYGKQNTNGKNTLSIINANITGRGIPLKDSFTDGRFFTGGEENGPNAYGWDVYAKNVKYIGARFVHLSNGTLTFDGFNEIYTNCENAWVNHVIFKENSVYKSSNSGTGDYGAFYFNKGKGVADGTAIIEKGAKTYFNIGTPVQPVFTGDVYKIVIDANALFDVNTLGHAIWFVAGSSLYYKLGMPEFNVNSGGIVNIKQVNSSLILNSRTRTNPLPNFYTPIYFAKSGEPELAGKINIHQGAYFYVIGQTASNSNVGIVRGGEGFNINLFKPADFDIRNNAKNSVAISANYISHRINININSEIRLWWKTSIEGFYDDNNPYKSFKDIIGNIIIRGHYSDSNNTNNNDFNNSFLMQDYGRIAIKGNLTIEKSYYDVNFDSNGGSFVPKQNIEKGKTLIKPENPIKDEHKFMGWFKDEDLLFPWNFENDIVVENIILYAKWADPGAKFEVVFDSMGGTPNPKSEKILAGNLVNKGLTPIPPRKNGFCFSGWYTDETYTTRWVFASDKVYSDMVLYAKWYKTEKIN